MSQCGLRTHPDVNDDTTIDWTDFKIEKAILAAGGGKGGIDMRMRWDEARKRLVPLERLVADKILKAVPPRDARLGEIKRRTYHECDTGWLCDKTCDRWFKSRH